MFVTEDNAVPGHWDDMKGDLVKLFPLALGSKEYAGVEKEFRKTGLTSTIVSVRSCKKKTLVSSKDRLFVLFQLDCKLQIERVQNATLWQNYQLMKRHLEQKNKHTNNEMLLFHGTKANVIDFINNQGFNRSYAGQHGNAALGAPCGHSNI